MPTPLRSFKPSAADGGTAPIFKKTDALFPLLG
jgi:hypothetical protein